MAKVAPPKNLLKKFAMPCAVRQAFLRKKRLSLQGLVALMAERHPCEVMALGSNPSQSINNNARTGTKTLESSKHAKKQYGRRRV